jgi:CubicO group peptidase (beta-lactamase class C family)
MACRAEPHGLRRPGALGRGSYLWDGFASTWFWVDPEHRIVFVGMVQRAAAPGVPLLQPISQAAVRDTFFPATPVPTGH